MKLTDGLFHQVFDEISQEYLDIESETQIIDIATARLAARPEDYDVIVTSNLYRTYMETSFLMSRLKLLAQ